MAGPLRKERHDLIPELLSRGHEFSLIQVMRLLQATAPDSAAPKIRVAPKLSLSFPAADVDRVEPLGEGSRGYLVSVNFMGLYGVDSPLPTFYTEDLIEEAAAGESVVRDLLDVVHHRIYELYFLCWRKYRLFHRLTEEQDQDVADLLFCLIGLSEPSLRSGPAASGELLRHSAVLNHFPRSAWGMERLVQEELEGVPVRVIQFLRRRVEIPPEQRTRIGRSNCRVGVDCYLGKTVVEGQGKFRLQLGPMRMEEYLKLLPETELFRKLRGLVDHYLAGHPEPLDYDLKLILKAGEITATALGGTEPPLLGISSWVGSGRSTGERDRLVRCS